MEKRKNPRVINNGAQWDEGARDTLRDLVSRGMSIKKIAKIMGRTENSITYQKSSLGIYSPNGPKSKEKIKSNSFINLIDLIKKSKENNKNPFKISRTEWTKENLATLKRLGDDKILHKAPAILGCTENAARIKYRRVFKKSSVSVPKSVGVVPTGFNPVTMETNKSVNPSNVTREHAKDITRSAREIARANGKRITMAMFFVEDL